MTLDAIGFEPRRLDDGGSTSLQRREGSRAGELRGADDAARQPCRKVSDLPLVAAEDAKRKRATS